MQHQDILPVLYDLSVTIGGEIKLKSLLTRTLQRLLYHTSFSAGFVCLDMPPCTGPAATRLVRIAAAVGDFDLITIVDQEAELPCQLVYGCATFEADQKELLQQWKQTRAHYQSFLRLPLEAGGVIVLLAIDAPATPLKLSQVLQPVLAQLSKAIVLCTAHDAKESAAQAQQEKLQQSLEQLESQFKTLITLSPIGVGLSCDGTVIDGNDAFLKLFGYAHIDELRNRPLMNCIATEQRGRLTEMIRLRARGEASESAYESVGLRKDGTQFPFIVSSKRIETEAGARTFSYFIDLTEQKMSEQRLRSINQMMRLVLETAPLRIFWKDRESRYLGCNQAFARDAGVPSPDELIGKLDSQLGWRDQAELYRADDLKVMCSRIARLNFEEPQTTPDGHQIWLRTSKVPLLDSNGQEIGVLGIYDDITEQKQAAAQIHQLAHFDTLTGLANRRLLQSELAMALVRSAQTQRMGALLFLDLDNFKSLNDTQGPAVGDALLIEVSKRLTACVHDAGMVARPGGDEFIVVLEGLSALSGEAAAQAELMAEKIRSRLNEPFALSAVEVQTTPSIGIVLFQGVQEDADSLLKHADAAMYQAKDAGRNTIRFFDPRIQADLEDRLYLVSDLGQAVDRGQLRLYFQKQVNADGYALGAEALIRWEHPVRGLVSPAQFIPLAEETGLIMPLGLWVLQVACRQLKSWHSVRSMRDLTLAVNVSARQFHQPDFVAQVQHALMEAGAKPSHLKLELTESVVLENVQEAIAKMRELKLLGIGFSLDDFGTGYSSLQYLNKLPLDQIKIDQSFVRDIATDPNDAAIVQTIIAMTEALGLNVIAEGVETREQMEFLEHRGCHAFQGYFFGKPLPLELFETDVRRTQGL
jgi:diguanylate cyclase (GGDEF)-like protein/PAS domain S-box-containing protein